MHINISNITSFMPMGHRDACLHQLVALVGPFRSISFCRKAWSLKLSFSSSHMYVLLSQMSCLLRMLTIFSLAQVVTYLTM